MDKVDIELFVIKYYHDDQNEKTPRLNKLWNVFIQIGGYKYIGEHMDAIFQKMNGEYRSLSGVPDYFGRNNISSGGDLSHYSSASLY